MTESLSTLSFVIPAYNEAAHITRTITSIFSVVPAPHLAQVIVCDHGSTDQTGLLARAAGAEVHTWVDGTIAAQRNRGAALATGDVLVFLDADTSLSPEWAHALPNVLARMSDTPMLVTGSHPAPPTVGSWLERHWFSNLAHQGNARHLGSAHLLITRAFFDEIGGFDTALETGEDFELCLRATEHGGAVEPNTALAATHHDFPKTLWAFTRREAWHGRGNFSSLEMAVQSPVSIATAGFSALHWMAYRRLRKGKIPVLSVVGIAALCAASAQHKFRDAPLQTRAINTGVFYFYYLGRSWSLARAVRSVGGVKGTVLRGVGAFMTR